MKKHILILTAVLSLAAGCASMKPNLSQIPGHYTYQHGWSYDTKEGHIEVNETGTMDYYPDGSALDSARQVYVMTCPDGGRVTWVFNYVSPSRWRAEGSDFYFAGIEQSFRMTLLETRTEGGVDKIWADKQAHRVMKNVGSSIGRETKFNIAKLTQEQFVWSYTYPDGHTDTWEFER